MYQTQLYPDLVVGASVGTLMGGALCRITAGSPTNALQALSDLAALFLHVDEKVSLTFTLKSAAKSWESGRARCGYRLLSWHARFGGGVEGRRRLCGDGSTAGLDGCAFVPVYDSAPEHRGNHIEVCCRAFQRGGGGVSARGQARDPA